MAACIFKLSEGESETTLKICGVLDSAADLFNIPFSNIPVKVRIDLSELNGLTPDGLTLWKQWIEKLSRSSEVLLESLPIFMIEKINNYCDILPEDVEIESFFAPFFCKKCSSLQKKLLKNNEDFFRYTAISIEATPHCTKCEEELSPFFNHVSYFQFHPLSDFNRYSVFNFFLAGVVVIDREKRIRYANKFASDLIGISEGRLIKKMRAFYEVLELSDQSLFCTREGEDGKNTPLKLREMNYRSLEASEERKGNLQVLIHPDEEALNSRPRWIIYMHDVSLEISLKDKYTRESIDKRKKEELLSSVENEKKELYNLSTTDEMTGLKNYRAFVERCKVELQRLSRSNDFLGLAILDVDKFKQFNDSYGHLQGDAVLKKVSEVLLDNTRVLDFVARYGGEEFVILFPQTNAEGLNVVLEKLRAAIERTEVENINGSRPETLSVTASFGAISINGQDLRNFNVSEESIQSFIRQADKLLYDAKESGRNRWISAPWEKE